MLFLARDGMAGNIVDAGGKHCLDPFDQRPLDTAHIGQDRALLSIRGPISRDNMLECSDRRSEDHQVRVFDCL